MLFSRSFAIVGLFLMAAVLPTALLAQERPYFVTYSHEMEEPGDLEIELKSVTGKPNIGNRFVGSNLELEYGVRSWWNTSFYLDGQSTANESTIFTGFRWENRFRPLQGEHWINPVLYAEFENMSADKSLREVVGHDTQEDFLTSNAEARAEHEREFEFRLILSSNFRHWNISENLITEKNVNGEPWEFGYALAASRPLKVATTALRCTFCAERFNLGAEMYGGLGDTQSLGLNHTSHYAGPAINWVSPMGMTFSFSPQFGLNSDSLPRLYRFGVTYEVEDLLTHFRRQR